MPERDGYPHGVPCWVDVHLPDPPASVPFYSGLFGWDIEETMPAGAPGSYMMARIKGGDVAALSSPPPGAPPRPVWNTYINVDSVDETAKKVEEAGGRIMMPPMDVMESGRMAVFFDPEGAVLAIWQPNKHMGAEVVNEHGALNFNTLNTRDVEKAKAFYQAVFGWGTLDLGGGDDMWTLPGYGDHLEEKSPGLREQMGSMQAPEGFIDVVAAILPLGEGQGQDQVPAHPRS
jgi:predicted enzyme related to lactoylglutathione lyase